MANDLTSRIALWFTEHSDGEFVRMPIDHHYAVTPSYPAKRCVLYTTKPTCVLHTLGKCVESIQVIGRVGLPNDSDVPWLQGICVDQTFFLGDNDPVDLMVFACLRSQIDMTYCGVSDTLLVNLGVSVNDTLTIPLVTSESDCLPTLSGFFPDYRNIVGDRCAAMLASGRKLELESVISRACADGRSLANALMA